MPGSLIYLRRQLRHLLKNPGFALIVVLTLALGIGATTAIFSLVEGVLLRPLPFADPGRLVQLGDHVGGSAGLGVAAPEIFTYKKAAGAFAALGGYTTAKYELSGRETPETVDAARVTAGIFPVLGVQPILGRVFSPREEDEGQPLAVIGDSLWRDRYHRDPGVLGGTIVLDRKAYSIIGVMPGNFEFPLQAGRLDRVQLWVPMSLTPGELAETGRWGYSMVARLKQGVTPEQAAHDVDRVAQQIMRGFPASMSAIHIRGDVRPLRETAVAESRPLLRTLFLAAAVILLIACANVAGLLLVRAIGQRREYALRLALGARARVILRDSVVDGLLLSLAAGAVGLGLAAVIIRAAPSILPESMPRIASITLDPAVAGFAMVLAVVTGVACSLAPAFAASRTNLLESLKQGAKTSTGSGSHVWLRSGLVVAEIAVALVLLTVSAAFLRSFQKMRAVDPGFRSDHVLVAGFRLPLTQYATADSADRFNRAVVDKLASKPGVAASGIANFLPATGFAGMAAYTIEGQPVEGWKLKFAPFATTYGDYFQAIGIRLLDGRYFTVEDGPNAPLVVIINQSMARHSWPGQRAIGKRMHVGNPHKGLPWATVVGVVADTKLAAPDQPSSDQWYTPAAQPATLTGTEASGKLSDPAGGYIVLRSALPPEQMTKTLLSSVAEIDPLLALRQVRPMSDVVATIEAPRRFNTGLITAFGLIALLLTLIGIYAVVAFSAAQRDQEIAIRMALGARRDGIARLVLLSSLKLALGGCALGVLASLAVAGVVRSFLFEVSATDPAIYIACAGLMTLTALAASALPAARAASADPVRVLRSM